GPGRRGPARPARRTHPEGARRPGLRGRRRPSGIGRGRPGPGRAERLMLEGIRVLEISSFVAAPLCGMTLAQLGAEVIRVDPLGGAPDVRRWPVTADGVSLYWAGLNKGKRSIQLDLRSPAGRDLLARLAAELGIVVTNARRPSYDELRAVRPDLIHLRITGHHDGRP